jgi:hypothetical protein
MNNQSQTNDHGLLVISYLGLRKAVGIIAIALPLVLVVGKAVFQSPGMQGSISGYYYTAMRDVLVGSLCAIAIFLLSYKGYERTDDIAGDLACMFALGVAFFPTAPDNDATSRVKLIGALHFGFASALFLILAFFSLVLFRKTDKTKTPTHRKLMRNRVYMICGIIILGCIALVGACSLLSEESPVQRLHPVFWLEAAAIWGFGWSWFTKGEGILNDL